MLDFFQKYVGIKNFIFILLVILLLIFIAQVKDIAILFFASYVISCSLNPIVNKLESTKKCNRTVASALVLLVTLLIGFLFLVPILVVGGQQISSFLSNLPSYLDNAKGFINDIPFLAHTDLNNIDIGSFVGSATDVTTNILSSSITFSKELAAILIYFLAACIIIYYFLADRECVKEAFLKLFPHNLKKQANEILVTISQKVGGYVLAQVVTMASVGIIVLVGLAILRVDYALILGLITAVFDIVPVVGPAIAFVIILIAVCKLSLLKISLVALIFIFAQWAENNLVRPYIFGKLLDLHPLIIYFFLLVMAQYLGIIGVIFAPAIAATVCVLFEELYIKNINK